VGHARAGQCQAGVAILAGTAQVRAGLGIGGPKGKAEVGLGGAKGCDSSRLPGTARPGWGRARRACQGMPPARPGQDWVGPARG
jgi:hypothetical protein